MSKEFYRMQMLAGIITESEYKHSIGIFEGEEAENVSQIPSNILDLISKASKKSPEEVKQSFGKETNKKQPTNEGVVSLIILIAGLIPVAMEAIGGLSNWVSRNFGKSEEDFKKIKAFNKKIEEKEKYIKALDKKNDPKEQRERESLAKMKKQRDDMWGSDFGQWMKEKAHKLHHGYTWPIRTFLKGYAYVAGVDELKDKKTREKIANILYAITFAIYGGTTALSHLSHLAGVGPVIITIGDGVKAGKSIGDIFKSISLAI